MSPTRPLRVLVWQWGRRGAGPRFAVDLAAAMALLPDTVSLLSLSEQSEQMHADPPPPCVLAYPTYAGLGGLLLRMLMLPLLLPPLLRRLRALAPDVAICAMPAALDLLMAEALRRMGVRFFVLIHDADAHPGDGIPLQMVLQRRLVRRAGGIVTLSGHVARRLAERREIGSRLLIKASHPPLAFGPTPPPPRAHGGRLRLLFFGRLLPYKGLDLFAAALRQLGPDADIVVRVAGRGPETSSLQTLRGMPNVQVDNRWVAEAEVAELIAWADAIVLAHTEASQSGPAAAAVAARRWVVATRVGGLIEQLQDEPLARMCPPTAEGLAEAIASLQTDPPRMTETKDPAKAWHGMATDLRTALGR